MKLRKPLRSLFALVAASMLCHSAFAVSPGLFRTYLASTGNDANPCTLQAPCRLLPAALNAAADGGEVWMLDSANYNTAPVAITRSVTVLATPGAVGSVVATGGDAIDIATGAITVTLRNLVLVPLPAGGGVNGIHVSAGAKLIVDNCLIANMPNDGILVDASAQLRVTGSTARGNGNAGVEVFPSAAGAGAVFDIADSTFDGNGTGVYANSGDAATVVSGSVHHSRVVENGTGVFDDSAAGASVGISVDDSVVSNNVQTGIGCNLSGSKIWASGDTVSGNAQGFGTFACTFESAGNNAVRNNSTDVAGVVSNRGTI